MVLKRSLGGDVFKASLELFAALAASASAAAAANTCWRDNTKVCSKRSSNSLSSGLLMSLGLPEPNILDEATDSLLTGTVRGNNNNGLRPSAIEEADETT